MNKTLYLHIGHYKTGTTALQVFMEDNPKFLARNGLAYAKTRQHLSKHSILAFSLYKSAGVKSLMHGYNHPDTPEQIWAELFDEVRRSSARAVIASSEELIRLGNFPKAVQLLKQIAAKAGDIDIRVIAYLRPVDSHLRSWYNQLVKMGIKTPGFDDAVSRFIEPVHYDYGLALKPWVDIFGAEAVTLRPYRPSSRGDDSLYQDFLSLFGLTLPNHGVQLPLLDPNPRMDDRMVEMVRMMQNADIPRDVIKWTTIRTHEFYEKETAGVVPADAASFRNVRQRALDGLDQLRDLPGSTLDLELLRASLPEAGGAAEGDGWLMAGLLLNELQFLRQRTIRENAEITERLRLLEKALGLEDRAQE